MKPFFFRTFRAFPLLALMLGGCVSLPGMQEAPVPGEATLQSRANIIARQPALNEQPVPSAWWQLFNDQTLSRLQAQAASTNLDLLTAATRIEESRAQLGLASAARRPQLGANAGYGREAISENSGMAALGAPTTAGNHWQAGLQASWELDLWGHLRHLRDSAEARLQASIHGMDTARVSVAGDVARTYLLLRGIQAQQAIISDNRAIADNLVQLTESRQRNGIATEYDAAAARADLASIDARQTQLEQQHRVLTNALSLLLAMAPGELDSQLGQAELPAMPQQLPLGIPSELARNRPDILQAEAELQATLAGIGAAKADFYPRISLTGSVGTQAANLSGLDSWSARYYSVGPSLYLPIFQGGRLQRNLELSEARHQQAGLAYQKTVLAAWHEVDDALSAYATELQRHVQLEQALEHNRTALHVAQRSYEQGTADFTRVLLARRSLLATQAELADCATAAALSVVSLYRALGGGWSDALVAGEQA